MNEHFLDAENQISPGQGLAWLQFALDTQCKSRPAGTRPSSRLNLATVPELLQKKDKIIREREEKEQAAADSEDAEDTVLISAAASVSVLLEISPRFRFRSRFIYIYIFKTGWRLWPPTRAIFPERGSRLSKPIHRTHIAQPCL